MSVRKQECFVLHSFIGVCSDHKNTTTGRTPVAGVGSRVRVNP